MYFISFSKPKTKLVGLKQRTLQVSISDKLVSKLKILHLKILQKLDETNNETTSKIQSTYICS